jgi:membrane-associated phospholipid phosphatase
MSATIQVPRADRRRLLGALPVLIALGLCPLVAQLAPGARAPALAHAQELADLERALGAYFEPALSAWLGSIDWLSAPLAVVYLGAHLPVTVAALGWVFIARPAAWPVVGTTFVVAQTLTVMGYVAWPCAPPSALGVADVTGAVWGRATLEGAHALQSPFAAMPSGHVAWALVAGGAIAWLAPRGWQRAAGALWPLLVTLITLATGNHFWLDAVAAAAVAGLALAVAQPIASRARRRCDRTLE